jgi:hypothetical protein
LAGISFARFFQDFPCRFPAGQLFNNAYWEVDEVSEMSVAAGKIVIQQQRNKDSPNERKL